jgi:hypothetical protein
MGALRSALVLAFGTAWAAFSPTQAQQKPSSTDQPAARPSVSTQSKTQPSKKTGEPKSPTTRKGAAQAGITIEQAGRKIPSCFVYDGSEVLVLYSSGEGFKLLYQDGKWKFKEGGKIRLGKVQIIGLVPEDGDVPDDSRLGNGRFNAMTGKAGPGGLTVVLERTL